MRQTAVLAVILMAGFPAFAVDTQLLNLVMPDARVMAGMNVTNARNSVFGQYILAHVPAGDQGLEKLITLTGFDPRQDLAEILAASPAQQGSKSGLLLARGNFDVAKITAALKDQQAQTYDGATLITPSNAKDTGAVAFINGSIAIAGDAASVKAALDRQTSPAAIDSGLAAKVQTLSDSNDAWSVSLASVSSLVPGAASAGASGNQIATVLKNIQSSSGGLKFDDSTGDGEKVLVTGQAVTDTPENAGALADVVRLIISLVTANPAANTQAAAAAQLLSSLQITTSDNAVNLALTVPEPQLENLLNTASALPGAHAGAGRGPGSPALRKN